MLAPRKKEGDWEFEEPALDTRTRIRRTCSSWSSESWIEFDMITETDQYLLILNFLLPWPFIPHVVWTVNTSLIAYFATGSFCYPAFFYGWLPTFGCKLKANKNNIFAIPGTEVSWQWMLNIFFLSWVLVTTYGFVDASKLRHTRWLEVCELMTVMPPRSCRTQTSQISVTTPPATWEAIHPIHPVKRVVPNPADPTKRGQQTVASPVMVGGSTQPLMSACLVSVLLVISYMIRCMASFPTNSWYLVNDSLGAAKLWKKSHRSSVWFSLGIIRLFRPSWQLWPATDWGRRYRIPVVFLMFATMPLAYCRQRFIVTWFFSYTRLLDDWFMSFPQWLAWPVALAAPHGAPNGASP